MRAKKKHEPDQEQEEGPEASVQAGTQAATGVDRRRITPVDIQQKEFRPALRGYNERDVDAFLDEVTEEVARLHAESKRLREDLGTQGTTRLDMGGAAEAEDILREAREEAARILAEAESKAAAASAAAMASLRTAGPESFASSRTFINAFLARERDFLQSLAALIQSHAESVKEDIRVSRDQAKRGATIRTSLDPSEASAPIPATTGPPAEVGGGAGGSEPQGGGASAPFDDQRTQPWRPAGLGPDRPVGSSATEPTAARDQRPRGAAATTMIAEDSPPEIVEERGDTVLDLTKVAEEPPPQDVVATDHSQQDARNGGEDQASDRSLRELFWGED